MPDEIKKGNNLPQEMEKGDYNAIGKFKKEINAP